jgi:hypothetical protein
MGPGIREMQMYWTGALCEIPTLNSGENDPTATSAVPIECASLSRYDAMARKGQ